MLSTVRPIPRRSQRSTKGEPPERLNYAIFRFASIFNVLSVNAMFNSAPPILWHNLQKPIVKKIEVIYMKVHYEEPCLIFQQMMGLPMESINNFMQWCEKSFVKDFIDPLDKFCTIHDQSKPFPLSRKKRLIHLVIVGVFALFVTAVTEIGLGSTAVYKSGKNEERISTLEANINRINENEKLMKEALEFMQNDIEKIGSILENTTSELKNLKRILPDIVSTTSYLSPEFVQTRMSLLEIGRDWIRGRINV
jgi:hypothetical protein